MYLYNVYKYFSLKTETMDYFFNLLSWIYLNYLKKVLFIVMKQQNNDLKN